MNQTPAPPAKSLITKNVPEGWEQLEEIVTTILAECGMSAQRGVTLRLPRGSVDVDVYAEETIEERAAYDAVRGRYLFAGLMVQSFSPYLRMTSSHPYPALPFDCYGLPYSPVFAQLLHQKPAPRLCPSNT